MHFSKIAKLTSFILCMFLFSPTHAEPSVSMETVLTDAYSPEEIGVPKESFGPDTAMIYVLWRSEKLKEGQKLKAVWIADNTQITGLKNHKIDQAELTLESGMRGKIFSKLPGNFWDGKFTLSKPDKGWPLGSYHVEIYVDDVLVKTIPFKIEKMVNKK